MNAFKMEVENLKVVGGPVDFNTAAITGERVSMKACKRVAFICQMGDSTSAVVEFTLKQHNAASSGTSKALTVMNPYFHKVGAATSFTKVEPTVAASVYTLSTLFADEPGVVVFEVLAEDLDTNNGFAWVSVDVTDSTAAKIGVVLAECRELGYKPGYNQVI